MDSQWKVIAISYNGVAYTPNIVYLIIQNIQNFSKIVYLRLDYFVVLIYLR